MNLSASATMRSICSLLSRSRSEPHNEIKQNKMNLSASATMRSICSLLSRSRSLLIVILLSLPFDLSTALTCKMLLASMSNVTSIWGTPRGAGTIPVKLKLPRRLLSAVIARSPSYTCTDTAG